MKRHATNVLRHPVLLWTGLLLAASIWFVRSRDPIALAPAGALYWPLLVPGWWVVRQVPSLFARQRLAIGRRDAVFLVCVVFFGTLLTSVTHLMPRAIGPDSGFRSDLHLFDLLGEDYEFEERFNWELPAGIALEIRNDYGPVQVTRSSDNRVWLEVTKSVRAAGLEQAEALAPGFRFTIEEGDGSFVIRSNHDDMSGELARRFRTRLAVRVPPATPVSVSSRRGAVEVVGLAGPQRIEARDGVILAYPVSGPFEALSLRGDVRVVYAVAPRTRIALSAVDGDVRLELPADSGFTITGDVRAGSFESDFAEVTGDQFYLNRTSPAEYGWRVDAEVGSRAAEVFFDVRGGLMEVMSTRRGLRRAEGRIR